MRRAGSYSVIFFEAGERGRVNVGVAVFDGERIHVRVAPNLAVVRQFCELVREPFPVGLGNDLDALRVRLEHHRDGFYQDCRNPLGFFADVEGGPLRLALPMSIVISELQESLNEAYSASVPEQCQTVAGEHAFLADDERASIAERVASIPWALVVDKAVHDRFSVHYWLRTRDVLPRLDGPGPACSRGIAWLTGSLGEHVHWQSPKDYPDDPEIKAQAECLAAAPEDIRRLLAALEAMERRVDLTNRAAEAMREERDAALVEVQRVRSLIEPIHAALNRSDVLPATADQDAPAPLTPEAILLASATKAP